MKKIRNYILAAVFGLSAASCSDFIEVPPTGVISDDIAMSSPEEMTTAAYAMLGDCWYTYPFNLWPYGDVASDDALKGGSGTTDTGYHPMEIWSSLTSTHGELDELWYRLYCAISRCNRAITSINEFGDAKLGKDIALQRGAEARFLRGHFYFKLIQMFRQVPWVDEVATANVTQESIRNDEFTYDQLMQKVIDDFKYAYKYLPETQKDGGRVNRFAAASYIAKCYLTLAYGDGYEATNGYDHINKAYMDSVVTYTQELADSKTYDLESDYGDIFLPENKNGKESIFSVQTSDYKDDNTTFGRANWSNMLNGCWGIWSCGWDFHKPSQNLVNAFKTKDGLPMFDDYEKEHNSYPVNGGSTTQKYDPRLFHTVGMPSWPYKYEGEYTLTKDNSRTPNTYGYYTSLKEVPQRSKGETFNQPWQAFAMNDYVLRYSDIILMRAEALIETEKLPEALNIVNAIRDRAKNSVNKHIAYAKEFCEINEYPKGYFKNKDIARKCLQWERRLELAMENGRYFDLRRWGIASKTLNKYFETEQKDNYDGQEYAQYLNDAHYTAGKNEFYPVPYNQLYYVPGLYVQNKGY